MYFDSPSQFTAFHFQSPTYIYFGTQHFNITGELVFSNPLSGCTISNSDAVVGKIVVVTQGKFRSF